MKQITKKSDLLFYIKKTYCYICIKICISIKILIQPFCSKWYSGFLTGVMNCSNARVGVITGLAVLCAGTLIMLKVESKLLQDFRGGVRKNRRYSLYQSKLNDSDLAIYDHCINRFTPFYKGESLHSAQ